jgi:phage-related protein
MLEFSVEFYETANGQTVVEDELEALEAQSPVLHALLTAGLDKLKHRENHRPPLCLPIGEGLFELRVGHKDIARVLWFFQYGRRIIAVRCFVKKSRKTPQDELALARRRMNDYLSRRTDR